MNTQTGAYGTDGGMKTQNLSLRGRKRALEAMNRSGAQFHGQSVATLVFVPWSVFAFVAFTTTFLLAYIPAIVYIMLFICLIFSVVLAFIRSATGPMYQYISILSLFALVLGFGAGKTISDRHMVQYWSPVLRPVYEDISPVSPAFSVQDGGTLKFTPIAQVDHQHVVGLQTPIGGSTYCVAPIRADAQNNEVNFWAAGLDCCGHRSAFTCDDSTKPGKGSGIVIVRDGSAYNIEQHQRFQMAAEQAAAAFGLHLPKAPIFVRWTLDAEGARTDYMIQSVLLLLVWCSLYLAPSLAAAAFLHWSSSKGGGGGSPV
jgi:hypothetical protein